MAQTNERNYWTPREVAEFFRISTASVFHLIHEQKIVAIKPKGRYRIPAEEVERIKNTAYVPEARVQAEEFKRRENDREIRQKASMARLNQFKVTRKDRNR